MRSVNQTPNNGRCFLPGLLLLLSCGGCTILQKEAGQPIQPSVALLEASTDWTVGELLDLLGPPNQISPVGHGSVWLYEKVSLVEKQFGVNLTIGDIKLLKAVVGKGEADREVLVLRLDAEGRLLHHQFSAWSDVLGSGGGIQYILAVTSVSSDGGLFVSEQPGAWGSGLLVSRLPESLNRGSRLGSGLNGVQLKGTPLGAGQHCLELQQSSPN